MHGLWPCMCGCCVGLIAWIRCSMILCCCSVLNEWKLHIYVYVLRWPNVGHVCAKDEQMLLKALVVVVASFISLMNL